MHPRRHRADDNQAAIVKALRKAGVAVFHIGRPCDLLCRRAGSLSLLDCSGSTKNRKRDPDQLAAFALWGVVIVKDEAEALKAVGL
jgi:hypothetical protein